MPAKTGSAPPPAWVPRRAARGASDAALRAVRLGEAYESDICGLFEARGDEFQFLRAEADLLRLQTSGDSVSYVVNRNLNYFDVNTHLSLCRTVKEAAPGNHIHAFSPLEVGHGARTLGLSLHFCCATCKTPPLGDIENAPLSPLGGKQWSKPKQFSCGRGSIIRGDNRCARPTRSKGSVHSGGVNS